MVVGEMTTRGNHRRAVEAAVRDLMIDIQALLVTDERYAKTTIDRAAAQLLCITHLGVPLAIQIHSRKVAP